MANLASIELNADQDVAKGNKIPLNRLFPNGGMWQEFQLLEDVQSDKTRINVAITRAGSFRTKANTTRKKGEKTNCSLIFMRDDFSRKIAAIDDIKKGDKLTMTLEKF